jgi:phosphate transport system substrate-binding protein
MTLTNFIRVVAFAVCAATVSFAYAASVSGAGATFPYPIYAKWADMYQKQTGLPSTSRAGRSRTRAVRP